MNKAITDGVLLTPPAFTNGLDVYSSGDGTPGSPSYHNAPDAKVIPHDPDFGGALELHRNQSTQRLRYMGETPLLPGCYLRVTARVKVMSGGLPSVRIAAFAGGKGGHSVPGAAIIGPATQLRAIGEVFEVSAVVGAGSRLGVDMVWGNDALYGHFGIDLSGAADSVVRIDDLQIEDITSAFLRNMLALVDVRDFGARGDGTTDDTAAFEAANVAAKGRTILVPHGIYPLSSTLTLDAPVRFEGSLRMPAEAVLMLRQNFDLLAYASAFGDIGTGFRKGFQALLNSDDQDSFDLAGHTVPITEPIDLQAAVPGVSEHGTRRMIRNGRFQALGTEGWNTKVVTARASYTAPGVVLNDVENVDDIEVGSLVEGAGVGFEVYVRAKNPLTQQITLSAPLMASDRAQVFTFTRFPFMLDFSGFSHLNHFVLSDVEFKCNHVASGVMLAPAGRMFQVLDCTFTRPAHRGLTSVGIGCESLVLDRCHFVSLQEELGQADRTSIGFNTNADDIKISQCHSTGFLHFGVVGGRNSVISGNHLIHGDGVITGTVGAGLIIARGVAGAMLTSNHFKDCGIIWVNQRDRLVDGFRNLTLAGNIFVCARAPKGFSFIVIKPHGWAASLKGLSVTGNHFQSDRGIIDRVEQVDAEVAGIEFNLMEDIRFSGNAFHNVKYCASNPRRITYEQAEISSTWVIASDKQMPFAAPVRSIDMIVPYGPITSAAGTVCRETPFVVIDKNDAAHLCWSQSVSGVVQVSLRLEGYGV